MLDVSAIRRRFGDRDVVAGISLAIADGEHVALMGPSGCGKTTLLQMIGLLDRPDDGSVKLGDVEPWRASASVRAELRLRSLGFVFQHSNLLPHLTARENVALPAWRAGTSPGQAAKRAGELLDQLGVGARADAAARELSIGEGQRVAVARALINKPRLVLADEPTGSLDAASAAAVLDALMGTEGVSVLVVTHDPDVAARAARTLHMKDGKLAS